jgi:hypothetical protein
VLLLEPGSQLRGKLGAAGRQEHAQLQHQCVAGCSDKFGPSKLLSSCCTQGHSLVAVTLLVFIILQDMRVVHSSLR